MLPLIAFSLEDNRHSDLVEQHIRYHNETRCESSEGQRDRSYVCLSFWGGMLILEESVFEDFIPSEALLPQVVGGFGFGFIWREVSRAAAPDALLDADVLLGKYIADRLYPGLPEPVPTGARLRSGYSSG